MEYEQSDPGRIGRLPEGYQLIRELPPDRSHAVYLAADPAAVGR